MAAPKIISQNKASGLRPSDAKRRAVRLPIRGSAAGPAGGSAAGS